MTITKTRLALRTGALALALMLSGLYIYSQARDQPAPQQAGTGDGNKVSPMSKTPDLDLIRALPKSGPLEFRPEGFAPDRDETNPSTDGGYVEPGSRPLPFPGVNAPKFNLNDALSKTGTIKADKIIGAGGGGESGLFGDEPDEQKE